MIRVTCQPVSASSLIVALAGVGCQLRRPATIPSRMIEPQLLDPQLPEPASQRTNARRRRPDPAARYPGARAHRPPAALPAAVRRADRRPYVAMVVCARPVSGHGTPPRIGVESRIAPGRCGQRSRRWPQRYWPGISSRQAGHDSSAPSSSRSPGPTASSRHRWCGQRARVRRLPGDLAAAAGRLLRRLASEGLARVGRTR